MVDRSASFRSAGAGRSPRPRLLPLLLLFFALPLAAQSTRPAAAEARSRVQSPIEFLGFEPGTDRRLAGYDQVWAYFEMLAATTDRVRFSSIGRTTEGRELGFAVISSPSNLAHLEEIRRTNLALVDPRKLEPDAVAGLIARGRTIVCLNASIHSVEVGPTQATLPLAHLLATTQDAGWLRVLDDVVLLMLPCHNPDGYVKQVDWYRTWVGTPHEGCPLPDLYHRYAGHDNNRDWFMFNLQETRLTVKGVYLHWVPQIVMDMHQMEEGGPRMFTPPFQDPIEPHVDPILIAGLNDLGTTVQQELIGKGLTGVVNRTLFDAWSPSRAYMHYHGGVRFLCEIASCRQATPIEQKGLARKWRDKTDLNPAPWTGDRWCLADIVRYHNEAALAVLRHASRNRERWLLGFLEVFRKACASTEGPEAYVIPHADAWWSESQAFRKLADVLGLAGVEASFAQDALEFLDGSPGVEEAAAGARKRPPLVIPRRQPFFPFVRALFDRVDYPSIRDAREGPIRRPYDVTAHSLPLMLDLDVREHQEPIRQSLAVEPLEYFAHTRRIPSFRWDGPWPALEVGNRIGVYDSFVTNTIDEGWLRWFLDDAGVPHRMVGDPEIALARSPEAATRATGGPLDVLILPSLKADQILNGNPPGTMPPAYCGGIGASGATWIDGFVRDGGTLVALSDSTALPIKVFRMPVRNALSNLPEGRRLNVFGAMLKVELDDRHPLAVGRSSVSAMFHDGKAFESDAAPDRDQTLKPVTVGRWAPAASLRLAGHAEDLDLLGGKGAIVQCTIGKGQVILFGFAPHFRGQTWGTFPLLLKAIDAGIRRN